MAQAIPGPLIKSIHGRIGNLVFYYRYGKQCVRIHVIPRNPDTEAQRIIRRMFRDAVRSWQAMTEDDRYKFNRKARYLSISGYNLYISEYMNVRISGTTELKKASPAPARALPPVYFNSLTSVSYSNTNKSGTKSSSNRIKLHPG